MANYNSYMYDYAKLQSIVYENNDVSATVEQKERVGVHAKTTLDYMIETEERRKVTTLIEQQEEEFLKEIMKPSVVTMDSRPGQGPDSVKSKRSSIFNIPQDRLREVDGGTPSTDSLLDLLMATKRASESPNGRVSPVERMRHQLSLERQEQLLRSSENYSPPPRQSVRTSDAAAPSRKRDVSVIQNPDPIPVQSDTSSKKEESIIPPPKPSVAKAKPDLHVHYVGSLDRLAYSAYKSVQDFPIIPSQEPPVFLRPITTIPPIVEPARAASIFESPETCQEFENILVDDYDETELMELPSGFGPIRLSQTRDPKIMSTENIVDYRDIFSKCYRNARRKTRSLLERDQVSVTFGDLADDRLVKIAASVSWEPLVQQWFALENDVKEGVLNDLDYENLIPMLFLGFEEIILEAQKRGLIPQDLDLPRDNAEFLEDPSFNPLELLGVFLLRNNPRHNNSWEMDSYVHSFRKVVREIRNSGIPQKPSDDFGRLKGALKTAGDWPLLPPKDTAKMDDKSSSFAKQATNTFLLDGIWDTQDDDGQLMTEETVQKISAMIALLAKPKLTADLEEDAEPQKEAKFEVNLGYLKTFLLTCVEEVKSVPDQAKEAIRQVVKCLPNSAEEQLSEADAAKILGRIMRMLKQSDLQPILAYCRLFVNQTEDSLKLKSRQAELYQLFDQMDETQTGYVNRPKVFLLLDKIFNSGIYPAIQDPRKWPVTHVDQLESHVRESTLPSGSTPTVFDVDDYQSLLGDKIDSNLLIPSTMTRSAEEPSPQIDHPFVEHIFKEYSSSGSTGFMAIPDDDLPVSVASKKTSGQVDTRKVPSDLKEIYRKVNECYLARCDAKRRAGNRPRTVWSVTSAPFMETVLTKQQFAAILVNFLGDGLSDEDIAAVLNIVRGNYSENTDERIARLRQEQAQARNDRHVEFLAKACDCLDSTGKGTVDVARLLDLWLFTGIPIKTSDLNKVITAYGLASQATATSFTKEQFVDFCMVLLDVANLDIDRGCAMMADQLIASVKLEQVEVSKASMRKAWLADVRKSIGDGNSAQEDLFDSIIGLIEKDGKIHSANKTVVASIALLESNIVNPTIGKHLLRFITASQAEMRFLRDRIYLPDSGNIGFMVVQAGKPGRIEKISQNDMLLPLSSHRRQGCDGSFICYPLLDQQNRCFGILNVDTVDNKSYRDFSISEMDFHEAVLRCLSEGFQKIHTDRQTIKAIAVGLSWCHNILPTLVEVQLYTLAPNETQDTPALRKVVATVGGGEIVMYPNPPVIQRGDPGFFEHLLTCAISAENVKEIIYEERHLACSLKDNNHFSSMILDVNFGHSWPTETAETDTINLLSMCQKTFDEHQSESQDSRMAFLSIEKDLLDARYKFTFLRLFLADLRAVCGRIAASTLADVRTITTPSKIHQQMFKAILTVYYPLESEQGRFDDWTACKDFVRLDLMDSMSRYDPTVVADSRTSRTQLAAFRELILLSEELVTGKNPIFRYFYRWILVCHELKILSESVRYAAPESLQAYVIPTFESRDLDHLKVAKPKKRPSSKKRRK